MAEMSRSERLGWNKGPKMRSGALTVKDGAVTRPRQRNALMSTAQQLLLAALEMPSWKENPVGYEAWIFGIIDLAVSSTTGHPNHLTTGVYRKRIRKPQT